MQAKQLISNSGQKKSLIRVDGKRYDLLSVDCESELSSLFEFRVRINAKNPNDLGISDKSLPKNAVLDYHGKQINGLVRECCSYLNGRDSNSLELIFVPCFWALTLEGKNRIFQDRTVPEILDDVLSPYKNKSSKLAYSISLKEQYPKYRLKFQYEESDFHFAVRIAEEAGIFYYFDMEKNGEIVFFDDKKSHTANKKNCVYTDVFKNSSSVLPQDNHSVFRMDEHVGFATLRNLHEAFPCIGESSFLEDDVDPDWAPSRRGLFEDPPNVKEGEEQANKISFYANVQDVFAGNIINLKSHPQAALNQDYFVLSVTNSADASVDDKDYYQNLRKKCQSASVIVAVPLQDPYQPRLQNKVPRMNGPIRGQVKSKNNKPIIDGKGRYSVEFKDVECNEPCYLAKFEFYGGKGVGMDMPLQDKTMVLVGFLEGNPDLPFIQAALADEDNVPLNARGKPKNYTIKTPAGNQFAMTDTPTGGRIDLSAGDASSMSFADNQVIIHSKGFGRVTVQGTQLNVAPVLTDFTAGLQAYACTGAQAFVQLIPVIAPSFYICIPPDLVTDAPIFKGTPIQYNKMITRLSVHWPALISVHNDKIVWMLSENQLGLEYMDVMDSEFVVAAESVGRYNKLVSIAENETNSSKLRRQTFNHLTQYTKKSTYLEWLFSFRGQEKLYEAAYKNLIADVNLQKSRNAITVSRRTDQEYEHSMTDSQVILITEGGAYNPSGEVTDAARRELKERKLKEQQDLTDCYAQRIERAEDPKLTEKERAQMREEAQAYKDIQEKHALQNQEILGHRAEIPPIDERGLMDGGLMDSGDESVLSPPPAGGESTPPGAPTGAESSPPVTTADIEPPGITG